MASIITISVPKEFDRKGLDDLLNAHNTTKNAILNRFLAKLMSSEIDIESFLNDDLLINSEVVNLTKRLADLESSNLDLTERLILIEKQLDLKSQLTSEHKTINISGLFEPKSKTEIKKDSVTIKITNQDMITFDCYPNESISIKLASQLKLLECDVTNFNNSSFEVTNFNHLGSAMDIVEKISSKLQKLNCDVIITTPIFMC